jgi:hypothetical protein
MLVIAALLAIFPAVGVVIVIELVFAMTMISIPFGWKHETPHGWGVSSSSGSAVQRRP